MGLSAPIAVQMSNKNGDERWRLMSKYLSFDMMQHMRLFSLFIAAFQLEDNWRNG